MEYTFDNGHVILLAYRQRCLRKEAQDILLNHPTVVCKGTVYEMKSRHISAGVYEVYKDLERKMFIKKEATDG